MKNSALKPRAKTKSPSWQVIYMDLMTNIMVFFVIIWSLSQGKGEGISETAGDVTTRLINLPGDVLFSPGQTSLTGAGKDIIGKLFRDENGRGVLSFDSGDLTKRMLVFHGHTDSDGKKAANINLSYKRALSAYEEVKRYNPELAEHVIICSHADNSAKEEVPKTSGPVSAEMRKIIREIKAKNRRITIEDRTVNRFSGDDE